MQARWKLLCPWTKYSSLVIIVVHSDSNITKFPVLINLQQPVLCLRESKRVLKFSIYRYCNILYKQASMKVFYYIGCCSSGE